MPQAWQMRGIERQNLLEKIKREILEKEESWKCSRIEGWAMLLHYLHRKLVGAFYVATSSDYPYNVPFELKQVFLDAVLGITQQIDKFKRCNEEGEALIAELFEWVAKEITHPYHRALQQKEFDDPKTVFGATSAVDDVPFPSDH